METLIICPDCNNLLKSTKCDNCSYEINNEQILIDLVYSEYNNALELCENKMVYSAWKKMEEVIKLYPFLLIPLELCFYLAIEFGEYDKAIEYLNQMQSLISEEQVKLLSNLLSTNIGVYNQILSDKRITELSLEELTFIQLYLLKLKNNKKCNLHQIDSYLNNYSPNLIETNHRSIKKYKRMLFLLVFLASILILLLSYFTKQSSRVLTDDLNIYKQNKIDMLNQIEELQNESNMVNRIDSLFSFFSHNYYHNKNIDCGNLLIQNPEIIEQIKGYNLNFMIENVCDNLYYDGKYELVNNIDYKSEKKPHAFFKHIMKKAKDSNDRIACIKEFVEEYPLYEYYTAPLLKELFDYYLLNDETEARKYALALQKYIENHPDPMYKFWYTKKVINYLEGI